MRLETRATINGRRWRVRMVKARELPKDRDGDCDHPPGPHPTIRIRRNLRAQRLLEVTVHETLHAAIPSLAEETVTDAAAVVARVLFSLAWRRHPLPSRPKAKT